MSRFKIKFRNGINGTPEWWIPNENVHVYNMSPIRRRTESRIKGQPSLIGYDGVGITLRNKPGGVVNSVFNGDLSAVQRYIFELYGIKTNGDAVKKFEGIADFSSISRPQLGKQIKFNILDKLKALDILTSTAKQRTAILNWKNRISSDYDFHNFYWGKGQTGSESWSRFATIFFKFFVSGVSTPPTEDVSIYSTNGSTFLVRKINLTDGNGTVTCEWTSGDNEPGDSGQLVKDYGGGDNYLNYSSRENICDVSVIASFVHNYGSQIAHTETCLKKGETLRILDTSIQEYKIYLVIDSWLDATPSQIATGGVQTTWIRLYPADISWLYPNHRAAFNGFSPISDAYPSTYYNEAENYIDLSPASPDLYGGYAINSFDALKILAAIVKNAWPDVTITNRLGTLTFPIALDYYRLLIDEMPLDKHPYDALKMLADSLRCYVYFDQDGVLVLQKRSSTRIGTDGTLRIFDATLKASGTIKDFWDKLVDGVTVVVKSGKTIDGVTLEGKAQVVKYSGIKPRNELKVEIISPDSIEQTQDALNSYALTIATEYLEFYGKRHTNIPDLNMASITDDMLDWDLMDRIEIDSIEYFFENFDIDLFNWKASLGAVEIEAHDYDRQQVHVPLSQANYAAAIGMGSGSGGTSTGVTVINQAAQNPMPRKNFTYQFLGQTGILVAEINDDEFADALDFILTTTFLVNQIGGIRIYDLGGDIITIAGIPGGMLKTVDFTKRLISRANGGNIYMDLTAGSQPATQGAGYIIVKKFKRELL